MPEQNRGLPVTVWLAFVAAAGCGGYLIGQGAHPTAPLRVVADSSPMVQTTDRPVLHSSDNNASSGLQGEAVADTAERATRFVVHIEVGAKQKPEAERPHDQFFFGPPSHITPDLPLPQGKYGSAAGVIIKQDGYILTNAHVVRGADEIKVTLTDGREFPAEVVGRDAATDLAVLKVKADKLPTASFADSSRVRPGQWAIAIGSPFHLDHSVSLGIVSALKRSIGDPFSGLCFIQTDAAINPGSSGGPLLNLEGDVIGINCVVRSDAQNIAFAIPSNTATEVYNAILSGRPVIHNYIGIKMEEMRRSLLDDSARIMVTYTSPESPAYKAGIRDKDLIKAINGKSVRTILDVKQAINTTAHGGTMRVTIVRDGNERGVTLQVAQMPEKYMR